MLIFLLAIPYLNYQHNTAGVWFVSVRGRQMASVAAVMAAVVTPLAVVLDEFVLDLAGWMAGLPGEISNGLLPFALMLGAVVGFYIFIKNKFSATNTEALQSVFVLFLVAFIVLTITGIWFRGEGMTLVWP
jgi:hypothetical protein